MFMSPGLSIDPTAEIRPDAEYLLRDLGKMSAATRYFAWQKRLASPYLGSRIVEAGCGIGNFTETLKDRESVLSVDAEECCIERHHRRFQHCRNIRTELMDACAPEFRTLASFRPDTVVCLNVMEHIAEDQLALSNIAAILPAKGKVILLVPAFQALYGPTDEKQGHHRRYRKADLAALAQRTNLKVVKLHYLNSAGFIGWWINSKTGRDELSESQITIFDKLFVLSVSTLESLLHPPFGQSVFAVFEKP